jgi:F-type H+-transporting ATPase subunit epsilon
MPNYFTFEVHTPHRLLFSDSVEAIVTTLSDGEIGIYADHSPFTAPVYTSVLKIKTKEGEWKEAFITEGIIEVTGNKTVLLVEAAEWPEDIDYERATAAKQSASEIIEILEKYEDDIQKNPLLKFEKGAAVSKLKRAQLRLQLHDSHK